MIRERGRCGSCSAVLVVLLVKSTLMLSLILLLPSFGFVCQLQWGYKHPANTVYPNSSRSHPQQPEQ